MYGFHVYQCTDIPPANQGSLCVICRVSLLAGKTASEGGILHRPQEIIDYLSFTYRDPILVPSPSRVNVSSRSTFHFAAMRSIYSITRKDYYSTVR